MRILSLVLLLCTSTAAVAAEPDLARAKELYDNGAQLYDEGLYEEAITAFEASFDLSGAHALWFNIANAYERLGRFNDALDALNRYRAFAPAEERPVLERRMRNLERRIAEERAAEPASELTLPAPTEVAVTTPTLAPSEPKPPRERRRISTSGAVLLAAGGVLVAGGATTAAVTWSEARSWKQSGDRDRYETWRPVNNLGVVGAGVGAGLVGVGLSLRGPVQSQVGAGLSLRWRR